MVDVLSILGGSLFSIQKARPQRCTEMYRAEGKLFLEDISRGKPAQEVWKRRIEQWTWQFC